MLFHKKNIYIVIKNTTLKYYLKYAKIKMKNQTKNKRRQTKKGNKAKEVQSWDDIERIENGFIIPKTSFGKWIQGTIPMKNIVKMKWGDIDELTEQEFGYYKPN